MFCFVIQLLSADFSYAESVIIETIYEQSILNSAMRILQTDGCHFPLILGVLNSVILKTGTKEKFLIIVQPVALFAV